MSVRSFLLAASLVATATPADAALYSFSYLYSDGSAVRGVLDGTVGTDPNVIAVNAIIGLPTLGELQFPGTDVVTSFRTYSSQQGFSQAYVSFDGTLVDLLVTNASIDQGFGLSSGISEFDSGFTQTVLGSFFHFDDFRTADWSLSAVVPEPASWVLMIGGFGLVGAALRDRRPLVID